MDDESMLAVEQKLIQEVATILCIQPQAVKTDVPLPALGIDSMGFVELLVVIEKKFNLRFIESVLTR